MINKNSIDEMVRQKIAQGEEPHNLSAWANMERMLDGNNPYAKKEKEEKRRPWMFMFLTFALLSSTLVGGYIYFSQDNASSLTENAVAQTPNSNTTSAITSAPEENKDFEIVEDANSTSASSYSPANTNTSEPTSYASTNSEDVFADIVQANKRSLIENVVANRNRSQENHLSAYNTIDATKQKSSIEIDKTQQTIASKTEIAKSNIAQKEKLQELAKIDTRLAKNAKEIAKVSPTITETYEETIKVTEISNKTKQDNYGNRIMVKDTNQYNLVQQKTRTIINPRYVELTEEQEEAAQRRNLLVSNDATIMPAAPSLKAAQAEDQKLDAAISLANNAKKAKKKSGFFNFFKTAAQSANQKAINMSQNKFPIYTGMFVGLNAALVNTPHNFGGFQGGFSAMTPISRILSLTTEARFIHKNNSGYTVTDQYSTIRNKFVDNTSWTKGQIYTYEIDSVSTGHNLNNFYNLQVPILLSAQVKKVDIYAGVNVNYGFRLNMRSSNKSNTITVVDSANYALPYTERINTSSNFSSSDFGSRLGLGYTVGGAYNLNNKLYLDLRMSNLFWDNTKGVAKQEISDVFFKIPTFQLSVGYRFRDFDRDR